jgi:DNA repair exonuclease SbcCD ATPase subunit
MADQDRFRFNIGDDEPDVQFQDEDLKRRVSRLGQRVSFLTLLLPCLLAIGGYVAYRDLRLRATQVQTIEIQSFERRTTEADQKLNVLAGRMSDFETGLTGRLDGIRTLVTSLQDELRRAEARIEKAEGGAQVSSAGKADRKEIADLAARTDAALAAIGKELQSVAKDVQSLAPFREELGSAAGLRGEVGKVSDRLQKLENSMGKDLTGLAGYIERTKTDIDKIKTDLAVLQNRKLDREALDLEVLKTKKLYQMALDQEVGRLDRSLTTLQRRLDQVEKSSGARSPAAPLPPLTGGIKEQPVE